MLSLLAVLAAVGAGPSSEFELHRRLLPVQEARDSERTYWRAEGTGWRRVTRDAQTTTRHEWAPSLPQDARGPEVPRAPSGLFRPWLARPTGSWPEAVGIGDLNGDGRRDVAVVTSFYFDPGNDHTVQIFLQTASGTLAPPAKYQLPSGSNRSLDVGDVTGDGRADVVVGSGSAIVVLRQNTSGTLEAPVFYTTDNSNQIKIGDFNSDGRKDVAGIDWGTPDVAVYLQNAAGTLDPPTIYAVPHGGYDELESGDVNNDGRDDIVVMSGQLYAIDVLGILVQTPAGGFAAPAFYDIPVNQLAAGAEVADVNGDSRKDVVITYGGNSPSSFLGIFAQNGVGTLNAPFSVGSYDIPESIESADLDANGRADLAVLHGGWNAMGVYLQGSTGSLGLEFLEPVSYASHYEPQGLALGDVNADGRTDAVIADYGQGVLVLYQKSPYDLGLTLQGPSAGTTGENVSYDLSVTNYGLNAYSGGVVTLAPSPGLQFVSTQPVGACVPSAGVVTCALPSLMPGQALPIVLTMLSVAGGPQTIQASVAGPQPDGFPGDNAASVTTQFLGTCQERLQDGSFELGTSTPFWGQASTNFGTPLCTVGLCGNGGGTAGPHSGSWWAWFGGIDVFEQGALQQSVAVPVGTATLRFHLWIGARSGNGADFLRALIDGTPVFAVTESTPGYASYTPVAVDVSGFANGATHQLRFESTTFGPGITNIAVDDVSLEWCPFATVSVSDAIGVTEGDGGSTNAVFNVSLSQPAAQPVTVQWATGNPTTGIPATPGADYMPGSGQLTFSPGSVSIPLDVPVLGDVLDEHDERFAVTLSAPAGALLGDAIGEVTIVDNDPLPNLVISDALLPEGHTGATPGLITIGLSPVSGRTVSGTFSTSNGTAIAGSDYTATSGVFTVPAGSTSAVVSVPVLGDVVDEVDETFTVDLATADFANLIDPQAVATIDDDDGPSLVSADVSVTEGNAGTTPASFTLSLSGPSVQPVTLDYATAGGTAVPVADFTPASGSVTFAPGQTSATVTVQVVGDTLDEPNEFFDVLLSNVADAFPADGQARGAIVDDDAGVFALAGELTHGVERWRSLAGPATRDLFVLSRAARSSYEVVVDASSGDYGTGNGPILRRWDPAFTIVLQDSVPVGTGPARRLGVRNELPVPVTDYIEVASAGCSTDCGADDLYRISARETTLAAPRYNNAGGQVTVVLLQNTTDRVVQGRLWFWAPSGALRGDVPFTLGPRESLSLVTASVIGVAGTSGSVTATHDAPYGGLAGKAVAIEPGTGFAFDTPFQVRRR
jgi:FG-GAP-like repeat/Calx-beta domain/Domain of unknown function DUF11